ncbi:hypothetical protein C8Q74DRAFT_1449863 [Fomes fomentarius]|nr:hypothetical protein C8Q74DRAFT_1449863 [Fomes fomentarius]
MSAQSSTALPQGPAAPSDLNGIFGAFFIGAMIGLVLYGMAVQQAISYYRTYVNDGLLLKSWVFAIILLETLHSLFSVHPCYYYLVSNYAKPEVLVKNIWSFNLLSPLQTGAMVLCQTFYLRRIHMIRRRWGLAVGIVTSTLMAAELGFSIAAAIKPFQNTYTFEFNKFKWLIIALNSCTIPTDVILTSTLIVILVRSRTGFKGSNSVIATLVLYIINTGLLTGLVAIMTLILSLVVPEKYYYIGLTICGTKVYSNTLLAMLNSRKKLSNRMVDEFDSYPLTSLSSSVRGPRFSPLRHLRQGGQSAEESVPPPVLNIKMNSGLESDFSQSHHGVKSPDRMAIMDTYS